MPMAKCLPGAFSRHTFGRQGSKALRRATLDKVDRIAVGDWRHMKAIHNDRKRLPLGLALLLIATPALANADLPPEKYDIGGNTEAEVRANFNTVFGAHEILVYRVKFGQAKK